MGLPIIQDVLELVGKGVDLIFPDKNEANKIKNDLQMSVLKLALEEKKLVFQDLESARQMYIEETKVSKSPLAGFLRDIFRPVTGFLLIFIVLYCRVIGPLFKLPVVELTAWDYALIGTVVAFYFGLRHKEKETGKD